MDKDQIIWLSTTAIGSFIGNISILRLINDDKLPKPNILALVLNILYMIIIGWFAWWNAGFLPALGISIISFAFMVLIFHFNINRDHRGVEAGESLMSSFYSIDLSTNYLLNSLCKGDQELEHNAIFSLSYILDTIIIMLKLSPEDDDSHISLLKAENGKFIVISKRGISPKRVNQIEKTFRYGDKVVGVAGRAITNRETIYIPNIRDLNDQNAKDWVPLDRNEERKGSLICVPIMRGVGEEDNETPLAVICVTSKRIDAFDVKVVPNLLKRMCAKVETQLYLMEIARMGK